MKRADDTNQQVTSEEVVERLDSLWAPSPGASAPSATRLPPLIPKCIGRFQVVRVLGSGSFGIVCLAVDPQLDRQVAIKIPRPELIASANTLQRFETEAKAASRLDHAAIVSVLEAELDAPIPYIASSYCPGPDLATWLERYWQPNDWRIPARLIATLASAVQYAHDQGILHRDIKPSNVMLFPKPCDSFQKDRLDHYQPRLTDFGLAKSVRSAGANTRTGMILGTLNYISPEQVHSSTNEPSPATDLYSLGAVFYELLSGRVPLEATTEYEQLRLICEAPVHPPSKHSDSTPRDLDFVCLKCLEKEPKDRYASADDLRHDLHCLLDGRPIAQATRRQFIGSKRLLRSRLAMPAFILTAVALVAVVLAIGFWNDHWLSESDERSGSLVLDGTTDHMVAETLTYDGSHPVTLEAWIYSKGEPGVIMFLGGLINLNLQRDGDALAASVGAHAPDDSFHLVSDVTILSDQWTHIAGIYNGETLNLFVNGSFQPGKLQHIAYEDSGEPTHSVLYGDFPPFKMNPLWEDHTFSVGANAWAEPGFTNAVAGKVDEVRISRGVRYTGNFFPPDRFESDEQTLALYHFDRLEDDDSVVRTVRDDSGNGHDGRVRQAFQ